MNITIARKDGEPLSFNANAGEKVLYAALRNRITVPYECGSGTCGTCRAKLVSGNLDDSWPDAPGKKALKIKRGEFLMCQCVAQADCEIRIPAPVAVQPHDEAVPSSLTGSMGEYKRLTEDVLSFSVSLEQQVGFQAGQFMLLQLPGVDGARAYSMVNYSAQTSKLDFIIKHFTGGKCSEWFFDSPSDGTEVFLFGPMGQAIFEPDLNHDLLLLAGGSGIAGMMAILEHADQIDYLRSHSIDLIFGVRSATDMFYLEALRNLTVKYPDHLHVTIALSESNNDGEVQALIDKIVDCGNLNVVSKGFVHEHIDESRTNANTMAFIAGPPPMVDASIRELITACEFDVERIRYDKFA